MSIQKATLHELESLTELFDLYRVFYEQTSDPGRAREFFKGKADKWGVCGFLWRLMKEIQLVLYNYILLFSSVSMMRSWVLNDLFVKESARKKGFGEELLNAAIAFARETGAKGVLLETGKENVKAQRLYEKIGFRP
ncbi:GNAT family N-acetyltransferase [Peribacillus frigoritolerans]|nr:GNAT family N-acetyltransferase [Peribacillus frigoritolerans]